MRLTTIHAGFFRLDGGAMFGVVPKRMWNKVNPADEDNLCPWSMRCLLVETGDRKILIDTGMGDKQGAKFKDHFRPFGEETLQRSLAQAGLKTGDITDVLLTHLHFDHCGGALAYNEKEEIVPVFENATYWTNQVHFDWAMNPNPKEKASFLKENFLPLQKAGVLKFIDVQQDVEWVPGIKLRFLYGHTEAMMMPIIYTGKRTVVYVADLMPASYHIPMPWIIAYDIRPMKTLAEKGTLLKEALENNYYLYFEHDPVTELVTLRENDRGRIVVDQRLKLKQSIG